MSYSWNDIEYVPASRINLKRKIFEKNIDFEQRFHHIR